MNSELAQKQVFLEFDSQLETLLEIDRENVILEYFDLKSWLRSKIDGIGFSESINQTMEVSRIPTPT